MQPLKIEPTTSSFAVDLDIEKGVFSFSGESRPENAPNFFDPILSWLNNFKELKSKETTHYKLKVIFNFDYFNSTSTKYIVDIAKLLKSIDDLPQIDVQTEWHYKEIDEDIKESGKELIDWTKLNIELIPYK